MRKTVINDKKLYELVKEKEDYVAEHYQPLHDRSIELEAEKEEIRAKKQPHMKKVAKIAEKAIKALKKHSPIESDFEEVGKVYTEDGKVVVEITDIVEDFKAHFLEEKAKVQAKKK